MADPNPSQPAAPTGGDAPLAAPDFGSLEGDLAGLEKEYEPRIQKGEEEARSYESQAVSAEETMSQESEREAGELSAEDEEMQHWIDHTPTRQAAYATGMHAAPALAILTALGGKLTKLNGMQMLAATNGIVHGINESSEQKYNDSLKAWDAAYEKMRDHQRRLMDAHKLMLTAYQGRADAYQKAADAARRMTGDILDDKQRQVAQRIDSFKAQSAAWDKIQRVNTANAALAVRAREEIARETRWKDLEKKSATMPPEIKAQIAAAKARGQNAKAQWDENMKRRGQTVSNLSMPEADKTRALDAIDDANERLRGEMNAAEAEGQAIVDAYAAAGQRAPKPAPGGAPPATQRGGPIPRPGQEPPGAEQPNERQMALIKSQAPGSTVKLSDGSSWIQDADGTVRRVQ
jgi:hypothetical protein